MFLFFLSRLVRRAKWSITITLHPTSALYVSTFFSKTIGPNSTKLGSDYPWWWNIIAFIETKETVRIGYHGFRFQHEFSGQGRCE